MSDIGTKHMMAMYDQMAPMPSYFASMFDAREDTIYNSDTVEIDIEREDEDVSVVLSDISTGVHLNTFDKFTNKEFTPPAVGEGFTVTASELQKRMPGDTPFESVVYQANANTLAMKRMALINKKILRHMNLQAAQVMQTGKLDLVGKSGTSEFLLDFKPKATHFPQVTISWGAVGATPLDDLEALIEVIITDGKGVPDRIDMGANAFKNFINEDGVQKLFDNRRIDQGSITGVGRDRGAVRRGRIAVGQYELEVYTCGERYKDPDTGNIIPFLGTNNVIMRDTQARMDATFGGVPFVAKPERRALRYLPARVTRTGAGGVALWPNAFISENNKYIQGEVYTRPLMIPVAIDTFGCLNTVAP